MERFLRDLGYGWRQLVKAPAFTVAAVLTLAVGIGANTAIFTLINAIILRPLPYPDAGQLVLINEVNGDFNSSCSYPNFKDWRSRNRSFTSMAAFRAADYNMRHGDVTERIEAVQTSAGLFELLAVRPIMGRTFQPEDDRPGAPAAVILSYQTWAGRFGSDPDILGSVLALDGAPHTVIGVTGPSFRFPHYRQFDAWTPLGLFADAEWLSQRDNHPGLSTVARIKPEHSFDQARSDMDAVAAALRQEFPDTNGSDTIRMRSMQEALVSRLETPLLILMATVGLVLLIACANVASLLLARSASRREEVAVRTALGASRGRLFAQMMTESFLLSALGGLVGIGFAYAATQGLLALLPGDLPRLSEVAIDLRVLLFAIAVSFLTGLFFGIVPALSLSASRFVSGLRTAGHRGSGSAGRNRVRKGLVVGEIALALVLLVGASLLLRSLGNILNADPGFNPRNVLTAELSLRGEGYTEGDARIRLVSGLLESASALSGVEAASVATPLLGGWQRGAWVEGFPKPEPDTYTPIDYAQVTPLHHQAMGIPLLHGRYFTEADFNQKRRVVIVDRTFAEKYWTTPAEALGKRLNWGDYEEPTWSEIVGVVGHVKNYGVTEESRIEMWVPYSSNPTRGVTVVLRTETSPSSMAGPLRAAVRKIDPELPLFNVSTLEEIVAQENGSRRVISFLISVFACAAVLLAAIGIYGVMAMSVSQRRREVGIRIAVGAQRKDILRLVLGETATLAAMGLVAGVLSAFGLMRLIESQLFGVGASDVMSYLVTAMILGGVALASGYWPARRATLTDPARTLRSE